MGAKGLNFLNSLTSICIIVCLLTPYFIKINHGINEHQKAHCSLEGSLHIHNVEFDCDFDHYQLSTLFYPKLHVEDFFKAPKITKVSVNNYTFLSKYQSLHFVLRGPPVL